MRKLLYLLPALLMMFGTSCSNDEAIEQTDANSIKVTFQAQLPENTQPQTRAWSDGKTATNLTWVAYEAGTKTPVKRGTATLTERETSVSISLIKGRAYDIVFWAQSPNAPYSLDIDNQKVLMNYQAKADELVANSEDYDAFYAKSTITAADDMGTQTVTLKRPFVQVMFMCEAKDYMVGVPEYTSFTTEAFPEFDLGTGEPTGTRETVTFGASKYRQDTDGIFALDFGTVGVYFTVCSTYVLAPSQSSIQECIMRYGDVENVAVVNTDDGTATLNSEFKELGDPIEARNVPVQANYRVILLGRFFGTDVDYNVVVDPNFDKGLGYYIDNFLGYDSVVDDVMAKGGTQTLTEDLTLDHAPTCSGVNTTIDLNGQTLTINQNQSMVVQDGGSLTIKGGTLDLSGVAENGAGIWVSKGSSLKLENATVKCNGSAIFPQGNAAKVEIKGGSIAAGTYGIGTNAATVDNYDVEIVVEDAEITSDHVAAFINIPGKMTLKNVKATGKYFGVIARGGTVEISNSTIKAEETGSGLYWNKAWQSGTSVPSAGMTIGNRHATSYQYPTYVTLSGVTVEGPSAGYALYGWANTDAANGVWLTYDDTTSFSGDIFFGSDNITVNGVATKSEGEPKTPIDE